MKKQFAIAFGLVTAHHILDIRQGNNLHGFGIWKKYSRYFCIEAISHAILSMAYFCVIVKNPVEKHYIKSKDFHRFLAIRE